MEDPSQVEAMAEKIKDDSGFRKIVDDADPEVDDKDADVAENVRYGQEEVGRLFQLTGYIRVAAVVGFRKIVDDADPEVDDKDADVAENVRYGQEEVGRLFQLTGYIRVAAVVLVALLTFVAFIFINNTIRLSITARRREIAIMRLVGASNGFIRGPFITEGVLQALLGALFSIGVLELFRNLVIPKVAEGISWMSFAVPMNIYFATYGSLVLLGVIIGLFGSAIAMRRYLKV